MFATIIAITTGIVAAVAGAIINEISYGYLWWVTDKEKHNYAAIGDGGNVIYVNPEKKIVVGVAGTFKPRIFDRVEFIEKKLLPLIDAIN